MWSTRGSAAACAIRICFAAAASVHEAAAALAPSKHLLWRAMGARALYLYAGVQDTLFRIHGTNQPEYWMCDFVGLHPADQ